jgi:hypothetical protein
MVTQNRISNNKSSKWNDRELFDANQLMLSHAHWATNLYSNLISNLQSRASNLMGFTVVEIGFLATQSNSTQENTSNSKSFLVHALIVLISTVGILLLCQIPRIAYYPNYAQIKDAFENENLRETFNRPLQTLFLKTNEEDLFEQLATINKKLVGLFRVAVTFFLSAQILLGLFINANWSS